MHFPHIILFTSVISKSSINIKAISIFNNQQQRHENYKNKFICKQCSMFHSLSSQCQNNYYSNLLNILLINLITIILYSFNYESRTLLFSRT